MPSKRTLKRRTTTTTKAVSKAASNTRTLAKKQAADTKKQVAVTKRTLKRVASKVKKQANNNELQFIESLLGEDFESLSQARAALKREVTIKKTVKKTLKKTNIKAVKKQVLKKTENAIASVVSKAIKAFNPKDRPAKLSQPHIDVTARQKIYSLRDLRDGDRRKVMSYLEDRLNANALDKALLKPGERWAAQVSYKYTGLDGQIHTGYAKTYETYPGAYSLFKRLAGYITNAKITETQKASWLNQVKILKFDGPIEEWTAKKSAEKAKSDTRRGKVSKKLKKKGKK